MLALIIAAISLLGIVIFVILSITMKKYEARDYAAFFAIICVIPFLLSFTIGIIEVTEVPKKVDAFILEKAYIEAADPSDPAENAALTERALELNKWLFEAQADRKHSGWISSYPEVVLDLEPIG